MTVRGLFMGLAVLIVLCTVVIASAANDLAGILKQRYPLSRVEIQNAARQGDVVSAGARLRIAVDGLPAKPFRVIQTNTKSPRFHARDYARVDVGAGAAVTRVPGELRLSKGMEIVVLDVKVRRNRVHLFTHTSDPIMSGGVAAYGCTELVFRFDGDELATSDVERIQQEIGRWLEPA